MKKYLLSLLVGFVGFISFCNSNYITSYTVVNNNGGTSQGNFLLDGVNPGSSVVFENYIPGGKPAISISCNNLCTATLPDGTSMRFNYVDLRTFSYYGSVIDFDSSCSSNSCSIYMYPGASLTYSILSGVQYPSSSSFCPECPTCPEVNTGEILSGYILESEIDSGYCISNDLCPVFSGNNFSELIINDIFHESAPLINISIPQEYSRDYSVNENEFTLDISGYNVDYDYIDGIIKTQNSKPTVEDFNKIISELLPLFVPGLVIILFLIFVFRFVKKVF